VALGVEAVKAGRSVYFTTFADIVGALAKAEREGQLRERIRWFCRSALLIVDETGYLPVAHGGGNHPGKTTWGARHARWLQQQHFDHPAHQIVLQEMVVAVRHAKEQLDRIEAAIAEFVPSWSLSPVVEALQALRGINLISAVTFMV
jgi:hypothetical protein